MKDKIEDIRIEFQHDRIKLKQAIAKLRELGLNPDDILKLIGKWEVEKLKLKDHGEGE